ncbi:MAG: uncharacterized protein A8A55_0653 [Amphiamblys sp. WSBS2006]|nr:MAG: uncharacterized protein A8A55_0653 [Amphiamblys sp. WSBS2006]
MEGRPAEGPYLLAARGTLVCSKWLHRWYKARRLDLQLRQPRHNNSNTGCPENGEKVQSRRPNRSAEKKTGGPRATSLISKSPRITTGWSATLAKCSRSRRPCKRRVETATPFGWPEVLAK